MVAQTNYASFELEREENWQTLITEDVNGDGAKDIIVSHHEPAIGRELHIYHQQPGGSFAASPQRVEIKTEIIAVGFADLQLTIVVDVDAVEQLKLELAVAQCNPGAGRHVVAMREVTPPCGAGRFHLSQCELDAGLSH